MAEHIVRLGANRLAVVVVGALYSDGEVERETIERLRLVADSEKGADCAEIVRDLHQFFLERGDRDELRRKYGATGFGWYQASVDLVLATLAAGAAELCSVGTVHVFRYRRRLHHLDLVAPVHNVSAEIEAGTVEESGLAPFGSRSNRAIAAQLLTQSPNLVPRLAKMDRTAFLAAIGHVPTRVIGYFPAPESSEPGIYRRTPPTPAQVTVPVEVGDTMLFYLPTVREMMPYRQTKIRQHIADLFTSTSTEVVRDWSKPIEPGHLVGADVASDEAWGSIVEFDPSQPESPTRA
ncbi:MAG: hypothetical protein ACRDIY_09835 [Chloroflexota bacterium]